MEEQFERQIVWVPAFDRRHSNPNKNYGIHGVECRFHLIGSQGATQFVIYTNWQLPHVTKEMDAKPVSPRYPHLSCHPMAADLGYHRLTPSWEGQDQSSAPCDLLNGRPCYYDGSGLMAQELFDKFVTEGDDAVWRELERCYRANVLDEEEVTA